MPRIPLIDVPNAPQVTTLDPSIEAPRFRINMSEAAGSLMQETVNANPFIAAAGVGEGIGEGLTQVGNAGMNLAGGLLAAHNNEARNKSSLAIDEYIAKKRGEMETMPPEQWENHLMSGVGELEKTVEGFKPFGAAKGEIGQMLEKSIGYAAIEVRDAKRKKVLTDSRQTALVTKDKRAELGDYEGSRDVVRQGVKDFVFGEAEGERMIFELDQAQQNAGMNTAMINNAHALGEALSTQEEATKYFGPMSEEKRLMWRERAKREATGQDQEAFYGAQNAIASGEVVDIEGLKKEFPNLQPRKLKLIEKMFRDNRQYDAGIDGANFAKAKAMIFDYDGRNDADGKIAHEIDTVIATLPKKEAGMMSAAFSQQWSATWKDGKDKDIQERRLGYWSKEINRWGESGQLGIPTGRDKKDFDHVIDKAQSYTYGETLNRKLDELAAWSKQNPNADEPAWRAQMSAMFGPELTGASADAFGEKVKSEVQSWAPYGGGGLGFPGEGKRGTLSPNEIREKLKPGSGPLGALDDSFLETVKGMEGFNGNAYSDFKQTSIGYGTKAKPGEKSISKEDADQRLREELTGHASRVDEAVAKKGIKLTPSQRNALVSFDFNTGAGVHIIETSDDLDEIAARIPLYNKVTENGKKVVNKGLVNRRAAELKLWNS